MDRAAANEDCERAGDGPPPASADPAAMTRPDRDKIRATVVINGSQPTPEGRVAAPPPGALKAGRSLGQYSITGFLGRGGMALVYAAKDRDGAPVALKIMQETPFVPAGMLTRFRREAEATKRLRQHPHIVTVYDTGQVGEYHYIAMELVRGGRSVNQLLTQGRMPVHEALRIGRDVADALRHAHAHGVIHRDLKPGNILINEFGEPLLADFGLARMEDQQTQSLTLSAVSMGTPRYMSPEQTVSAKKTDHRTDVYSFGVVLYEMLTGVLPYDVSETTGMAETFELIRRRQPRPPRKLRSEISRDVTAVLLKLLEKEPGQRYQDMLAVVNDLDACARAEPVAVRIPSVFERFERAVRRHKWAAVAVAFAVFAVLGMWKWLHDQIQAEREARIPGIAGSVSNAGRIAALERNLAGETGLPEVEEQLLAEAYHLIVADGNLDAAEARFSRLLNRAQPGGAQARATGYAATAERELARLHLARGDYGQAYTAFGEIAATLEHAASEAARMENAGPPPRFPVLLAKFEQGLAAHLDGRDTEARQLWKHVLSDTLRDTLAALFLEGGILEDKLLRERRDEALSLLAAGRDEESQAVWRALFADPRFNAALLNKDIETNVQSVCGQMNTNLALLCRGALGMIGPAALAAHAQTQMPAIRALAYWLAGARTADTAAATEWRGRAALAATDVLPWLHYSLSAWTGALGRRKEQAGGQESRTQ